LVLLYTGGYLNQLNKIKKGGILVEKLLKGSLKYLIAFTVILSAGAILGVSQSFAASEDTVTRSIEGPPNGGDITWNYWTTVYDNGYKYDSYISSEGRWYKMKVYKDGVLVDVYYGEN
jgi:hypothetical protein